MANDTHETNDAPTIDLPELTRLLGQPAHAQEAVAGFAGGPGPWTARDAGDIVIAWHGTDPTTGVHSPTMGI